MVAPPPGVTLAAVRTSAASFFQHEPLASRRFRITLGVSFVAVHALFWLAVPVVPFLGISGTTKAILIPTFIVSAEVLWWAAILVLGAEVVRAMRGRLNPLRLVARFRRASSEAAKP